MLFDIQRRTEGDTEVVAVLGDVDLASLPRLATALGELGATPPSERTIIDLGGVDYLDPVCLGVLLAADLRVRRAGGVLTVLASGAVRSLLADSRLTEILEVRSS